MIRTIKIFLVMLLVSASIPAISANLSWHANDWSSNSYSIHMSNGSSAAPQDPLYSMPAARMAYDSDNYFHAETRADQAENALRVTSWGELSWNNSFFSQAGSNAGGWVNGNYLSAFTVQNASNTVNAIVTISGSLPAGSQYTVVIDTSPLLPESRDSWPSQQGDNWWSWITENSLAAGSNAISFEPGVTYYIYAYSVSQVCVDENCSSLGAHAVDAKALGAEGNLLFEDYVDVSFDFGDSNTHSGNPIDNLYKITAIDPIYRSYKLYPTAINNAGLVVGYANNCCGSGPSKSFRWTESAGREIEAGYNVTLNDVNNQGDVAGDISSSSRSYKPTVKSESNQIYYLWGGKRGTAIGINDVGSAITRNWSGFSVGITYALWDYTNDSTTSIPFRPEGLNNSNQIVGSRSNNQTGMNEAVLYDPGNGVISLDTLGRSSYAYDINDNGTIVGSVTSDADDCARGCAFIYNYENGMQVLPKLSPLRSKAKSLNSAGDVVGDSYVAKRQGRAVLWTGGAMNDLNNLLPVDSGWVLNNAVDINDSGQIIGTGTFNGAYQIFVLTPESTILTPSEPTNISLR